MSARTRSRARQNTAAHLLAFADDQLEAVLSFLDARDFCRVQATCKTAASLASAPVAQRIWRTLTLRNLRIPWLEQDAATDVDWKSRYETLSRAGLPAPHVDDEAVSVEALRRDYTFYLSSHYFAASFEGSLSVFSSDAQGYVNTPILHVCINIQTESTVSSTHTLTQQYTHCVSLSIALNRSLPLFSRQGSDTAQHRHRANTSRHLQRLDCPRARTEDGASCCVTLSASESGSSWLLLDSSRE